MLITKTTIKVGNKFLTPLGIGRNGLDVHDCLSELIANCFDWNTSKLYNDVPVVIKIICTKNSIAIVDNGAGMNLSELDTAINLAEAEDDLRLKLDSATRKGRYGMGLKISTLTLGWKFDISTISFKDLKRKHQFIFNSKKLLEKDSKYLENELNIVTEELLTNGLLDNPLFKHGTCILITDLVKKIPSISSIKDEIELRFTSDINNLIETVGLDFEIIYREDGYDDHVLKIEKKDINKLFRDEILRTDFENINEWNKKKQYNYIGSDGNEYKLRGFLQLLDKRSLRDQKYGLNLYYNGQLIERFHKELLLANRGRSAEKTYGELHLDGCTPDPSKKNFIQDEVFKSIGELINDDLDFYKYLSPATNQSEVRIENEINRRRGIPEFMPIPVISDDSIEDKTVGLNGNLNILNIRSNISIQLCKVKSFSDDKLISKAFNWEYGYLRSIDDENLFILSLYIKLNSTTLSTINRLYFSEKDKNKIIDFYKITALKECICEILIKYHQLEDEEIKKLIEYNIYPSLLKLKGII